MVKGTDHLLQFKSHQTLDAIGVLFISVFSRLHNREVRDLLNHRQRPRLVHLTDAERRPATTEQTKHAVANALLASRYLLKLEQEQAIAPKKELEKGHIGKQAQLLPTAAYREEGPTNDLSGASVTLGESVTPDNQQCQPQPSATIAGCCDVSCCIVLCCDECCCLCCRA